MSLPIVLAVGVLGGVGAIARFLLDGQVSDWISASPFPFGTFAVNLLGSGLLGLFVGAALGKNAYTLLGTGLIGAFTTFSTWAFESHRLGEDGSLPVGVANFAVSLILGVAAAWAGRHLGAML